jgi:RNA polymerase sigma-70 factor (ECF subfamily)
MNKDANEIDLFFMDGLSKRDSKIFGLLFEKYHAPMFRFAETFVFRPEVAEDIVQEVFVKLWESPEITIEKSLKAYLFLMVRNRCIDFLRALQVEDKRKKKLLEAQILSDTTDLEFDEATSEIIKRTINELPEQCRQVYNLSVYEDMKYNEIAQELGISVSAVKVQMFRARKYLRENLYLLRESLILFGLFRLFSKKSK